MKLSELKGKSVVGVAEARNVGVVEDVLVGPSFNTVEGLVIRVKKRGPEHVISSENVRAIGRDVVTIDSANSLRTLDQAPNLAGLPRLTSALHSRVVTQDGQVLGSISEVEFDPTSRKITSFEYDGRGLAGLLGRRHTLDAKDVISFGPGIVTVTEAARPPKAA